MRGGVVAICASAALGCASREPALAPPLPDLRAGEAVRAPQAERIAAPRPVVVVARRSGDTALRSTRLAAVPADDDAVDDDAMPDTPARDVERDPVAPTGAIGPGRGLEPETAAAAFREPAHRRAWGLSFDVGVPDGVTTGVVVALRPSLEVAAGVSYNGISPGLRAGFTWKPYRRWITPTLSVDVGHYFDGDANALVRLVTNDPAFSSALLDRVGYDYADAHAGVELGQRSRRFFIRVGVTRVTGTIHLVGTMTTGAMPGIYGGSDPGVTITAVSARLGMVLHFGR